MTARPTRPVVTADGARLLPLSQVADTLGIPRSTAHAWAASRDLNGFPGPARTGVVVGHGQFALYDLDAVRVWRASQYMPGDHSRRRARSDDPNRGGPAAVARLLGVETKDVCRWVDRRRRNGSPEKGEDGLYDLTAWAAWHATYVPDRGGYPLSYPQGATA